MNSLMLFPGDMREVITADTMVYVLYAKGTIVKNKDTSELSPYTQIKDYQFRIRYKAKGRVVDQLIYQMDINKWVDNGYLNSLTLIWCGDLDKDQLLDLIYITQGHHECFEVHLLKSSAGTKNNAFKEASINEECW